MKQNPLSKLKDCGDSFCVKISVKTIKNHLFYHLFCSEIHIEKHIVLLSVSFIFQSFIQLESLLNLQESSFLRKDQYD